MADADVNQSETSTHTPSPAPVVQVIDRVPYVPVGDLTFGANKRIDDAPASLIAKDPVKLAMWIENQAERTLRETLEKLGLRLRRNWTWVQVMNRVRKARLQIMEYPAPFDGGWHILRGGQVVARVSYPWFDAQGHLKFRVS